MTEPLDLEPIKARLRGASPPPWETSGPDTIGEWCVYSAPLGWMVAEANIVEGLPTMSPRKETGASMVVDGDQANRNAALIANAPTDIAALIAEVERLRAEHRDDPREAAHYRREIAKRARLIAAGKTAPPVAEWNPEG